MKWDFRRGIASAWLYLIVAFLATIFVWTFTRAGFSYPEIASYGSLVGIAILVWLLPKELSAIRRTLDRINRKLGKEKITPSNPGLDNEEKEKDEVKPSGSGAFGGMVVGGVIGTAIGGPVGTIIGGLIGAILGNQIEYEDLRKKAAKK